MDTLAPSTPPAATAADPSSWLTVVLRPAGAPTGREAARLAKAVVRACASADAVILDLRAVGAVPDVVRRAVGDASGLLARTGGALLVIDPDGRHHVGGGAVEIRAGMLPAPD